MKPAYVIGSGPNGLTAAITLARAGTHTIVLEAQPTIGGGIRSAALTLPGFVHDICSAGHPMALSSPAFRSFPLEEHGLEWIDPPAAAAHPFDDGSAALLYRSVEATAQRLGSDGPAWRRAVGPLASGWQDLAADLLGPLRFPRHPFLFARFGMLAPWPAKASAYWLFRTMAARALIAGVAAHSVLPLEDPFSSAVAWVLTLAGHAAGWPIPRRGSQAIADALGSYFKSLGGEIVPNTNVTGLDELRDAGIVLADVTPYQLLRIAGDRLPSSYRRALEKYRYGPGVFKMDWALDGPIPWKAAECAQSATVHLGGTMEEIAASERAPWAGTIERRPFVLLTQPSLFDPSRAPAGKHTAWAYCHVPNGSTADASEAIEAQIERFAPGFRTRVLARSVMNTADLEAHNANLHGGDIGGGAQTLRQFFWRPTRTLYRTPAPGLYLCSSSTPPGGGVHGMCGYHAARCALSDAYHR
jgi:phytoene dehydrogenase-like protein